MRKRRLCGITLALVSVLLFSQLALGMFSMRLVQDPEPTGVYVSATDMAFVQDSLRSFVLYVKNTSTGVVTLDTARSSFITPDGNVNQLSRLVDGAFATTLPAGGATSNVLASTVRVQSGYQIRLFLAWTLDGTANSATWIWEITGTADLINWSTPGSVSVLGLVLAGAVLAALLGLLYLVDLLAE